MGFLDGDVTDADKTLMNDAVAEIGATGLWRMVTTVAQVAAPKLCTCHSTQPDT